MIRFLDSRLRVRYEVRKYCMQYKFTQISFQKRNCPAAVQPSSLLKLQQVDLLFQLLLGFGMAKTNLFFIKIYFRRRLHSNSALFLRETVSFYILRISVLSYIRKVISFRCGWHFCGRAERGRYSSALRFRVMWYVLGRHLATWILYGKGWEGSQNYEGTLRRTDWLVARAPTRRFCAGARGSRWAEGV